KSRPLTRIDGRDLMASVRAGYTAQRATFQTAFTALSPNHPDADVDGHIDVPVGASIPGIPNHIVKADLDVELRDFLSVGVEMIANSGQFLRGDEANLLAPVPGFMLLDAT